MNNIQKCIDFIDNTERNGLLDGILNGIADKNASLCKIENFK
jgi:hypothetical protein